MQSYDKRNITANRKDMVTTQPDSQKLLHARNIPDEIPEQSHKLDGYSKIFLLTLYFTHPVDTFLNTPLHIGEASLTHFLDTLNSIVK